MHAKIITYCLAFITSPLLGMDCALAKVNHWNNVASTSAHDGVTGNSVDMKFCLAMIPPRIYFRPTLTVSVA